MDLLELRDWTRDYYVDNKITCQAHLESIDTSQITSLNSCNLHDIRDGQLVRFRGMVQDMYSPDFYFQKYEVEDTITGERSVRNGMYQETALCQKYENILLESVKNNYAERRTIVVISVPGLNEWAKEKSSIVEMSSRVGTNASIKRSHEENEETPMDTSEPVRKKEKKDNTETNEEKNMIVSKDHLLNFPIPNDGGRACFVKMYENMLLKPNQVINVIGFVSLDPMLHIGQESDEFDIAAEVETHNPPTSLIPRLQAIRIIHAPQESSIPRSPDLITKVEAIRTNLHRVFSQVLFGDELAADYVICHLFSYVYSRRNDLCLGHYPLNITNFPIEEFPDFPKIFYDVLAQVVCKSHYLECTLENLNTLTFIPKKDFKCNRLTSGILQLTNHTLLFIDETKLTTGELSAQGRKNYEAINNVALCQKISCDFQFYTMEYETDIPVLVLSENKAFVSCLLELCVIADPDTANTYYPAIEAAKQFLKDENRINDIRQYLEQLRTLDYKINEIVTQTIQEDFVQMRKNSKAVSASNLHLLLILARLLATSYGEKSLTIERWKQACNMELARLKRLPYNK